MRLYENAWPSNYDEIKTWYPVWCRDIFEMDALWHAWGERLDEIQAGIIQAVDNNFIDYADAQTITKLEAFLGIVYDGPRTLTERRHVVKAFVLGNGHIGQKQIKELIAVFTSGVIEVALVGGTVQITVTRDYADSFNLYDCHLVLDKRIPAHLAPGLVDNLIPVAVRNKERFIFSDFGVRAFVKEGSARVNGPTLNGAQILDGSWILDSSYQSVQFVDLKIASSFKNMNSLSGSVIIDSRWSLDGAYSLNGARTLQASLTEEEI